MSNMTASMLKVLELKKYLDSNNIIDVDYGYIRSKIMKHPASMNDADSISSSLKTFMIVTQLDWGNRKLRINRIFKYDDLDWYKLALCFPTPYFNHSISQQLKDFIERIIREVGIDDEDTRIKIYGELDYLMKPQGFISRLTYVQDVAIMNAEEFNDNLFETACFKRALKFSGYLESFDVPDSEKFKFVEEIFNSLGYLLMCTRLSVTNAQLHEKDMENEIKRKIAELQEKRSKALTNEEKSKVILKTTSAIKPLSETHLIQHMKHVTVFLLKLLGMKNDIEFYPRLLTDYKINLILKNALIVKKSDCEQYRSPIFGEMVPLILSNVKCIFIEMTRCQNFCELFKKLISTEDLYSQVVSPELEFILNIMRQVVSYLNFNTESWACLANHEEMIIFNMHMERSKPLDLIDGRPPYLGLDIEYKIFGKGSKFTLSHGLVFMESLLLDKFMADKIKMEARARAEASEVADSFT